MEAMNSVGRWFLMIAGIAVFREWKKPSALHNEIRQGLHMGVKLRVMRKPDGYFYPETWDPNKGWSRISISVFPTADEAQASGMRSIETQLGAG
jgi:hypothetical protein